MRLDLLLALRWMRKDPFFTTAIVFILALGIGANTAVFSVVDAVLLRPSPYPSAERLVRIEESSTSRALSGVPIKDYQRWAGRSDIFERIAPYIRDTVTLTGDGEPDQVIAVRSLGYFRCSVFPRDWAGHSSRPTTKKGPEMSRCSVIGCGGGATTPIRA